VIRLLSLLALGVILAGCAEDTKHRILISTTSQQMIVLRDGKKIAEYPVSTSKFGLGDTPGSNGTPLGLLKIRKKIGSNVPSGTVFKSRKPTGEILPVDAPGRDPIVTRILWLDGLEAGNRRAYDRYIYIHGTPEERTIGNPASYGCIRMRSRDVIELYNTVGVGARVKIFTEPFRTDLGDTNPAN
jgi:lipoprotein-anchoring transpeptidase ErfK/SrfK